MNLSELSTVTVRESQEFYDSVLILEDGEGPRWRFNYSNFKNDPNPDILLLGAYRHPTTGNNLVGGINLHYLDRAQIEQLAKVLPKIMAANSLYRRYHVGKRELPQVFDNFYRTYNASYIHGVEKDTMYPRYGLLKTTADWVKKKLGSILKTKKQREKDAQPQYPSDLTSMNTELDKVVQQLQQVPPTDSLSKTPDVKAAKAQQLKQQIDKTEAGIQRNIDEPVRRAYRDYKRETNPELRPTLPLNQIGPSVDTDASDAIDQQEYERQISPQQRQEIKKQRFEQEEQENLEELMAPSEPTELDVPPETPEISTTDSDQNMQESVIRYYSPRLRRYITETINLVKV